MAWHLFFHVFSFDTLTLVLVASSFVCELQVRLDSLEQSLELSFPQQLKEMDEAFSEMQASPFDIFWLSKMLQLQVLLIRTRHDSLCLLSYCTCHRHSWRPCTCFCASFRSCVRPATPCCRGHLKNSGPSLLLLCRTPLLSGRLESLQWLIFQKENQLSQILWCKRAQFHGVLQCVLCSSVFPCMRSSSPSKTLNNVFTCVHFLKSPCTVHFYAFLSTLHIFQLSLSWCTFHHFPQSYPFRKASHWVAAGAEAAAKTFRSLTRLEGPNEACEIQRVASGYHRASAPLKVPFIEEEAPLSPSPLGGELWLGIQWFKYIRYIIYIYSVQISSFGCSNTFLSTHFLKF